MTNQEHALVLVMDIGTTGGRVILMDAKGESHGMAYREYRSIFHAPTVIDHDPTTWINAVVEGIQELKESHANVLQRVRAISITSQRATIMPVDADANPLTHAILWQDKRSIQESREIEARIGREEIYKRTGLKIDPYFSLPKIMWFQNNHPEIYRKASCFLTVHDFMVASLTGEFKTDWTQASRTMLFNINDFAWDRELADRMGIDLGKLPEAYPTGTVAGNVTEAAAVRFGLPVGLPVVMAGGDQQSAAIGLGAIRPGIVKVTTGTGSFVVAPIDHQIHNPEQKVVCSASAVPGKWVIEAGIFTTGSTYRWLRDFLGTDGLYDELNAQAAMSTPGANGVLHIPHYAGSAAPYWNANASGVLFNLSLGTKKSDVVRAYLEGICYETKKNLRIIDSLLSADQDVDHIRLSAVHVSGGLARFDWFNQIQADIYGIVVIPDRTEQATSLGAAIIAYTTLGFYSDLIEAHAAMGKLEMKRMKTTNRATKEVYEEMGELHHALYESLDRDDLYGRAKHMASKFDAVNSIQAI
ncbi:hypothetical protein L1N85_01840 [Paenibacillus alkaliterrae]|uniref:FGGY-family carbohydrate kinase n=1 Tax=Paenibacillus alkaliterrae TaxID=320909 RepID=UPI001EFF0A68|nr:FGGY-family carbohydrate kinase [Paenibacillus alkaliterrae]MCF2937173.1 hypothetical protein [Paenibacillus alkaliterrae]